MVESDYLNQKKLKMQCSEAISVFTENNEKLVELRKTYNSSRDVTFTGKGADGFVGHCDNYVVLIDAIMTANDCDIADNKTLLAMLGTEKLDGSVILPAQREAMKNQEDELDKAAEAKSMKHSAPEDEKDYWEGKYRDHKWMAHIYEEEYKYWVGKEETFDRIAAGSEGLFKDSVPIRAQAKKGLQDLSRDFSQKTFEFFYNPLWKDGFEKLCNQVSVVDKCKEKWKDEKGVYKLDVLKDIYDNKLKDLSAPEVKAFEEILEELHPEAQKKVIGHVVAKDADIKGLIQGLVKSVGPIGKNGVGVYNVLTASDNSAKKLAGFKMAKDTGMAAATWAGTFWYNGFARNVNKNIQRGIGIGLGNANRTLITKGSYIKSISEEADDLTNVGFKEVAERAVKHEFKSFVKEDARKAARDARKAILNEADDIDDLVKAKAATKAASKAKEAADLRNYKVGVKWLGIVADVAFSGVDNFAEQKQARESGIEMSNGRVIAETAIEATTNVVVGAAGNIVSGIVIGGGAALLGLSAPAVLVAAGSAAVVWGVNEIFKDKTGKNLGENISDLLCDTAGIK